MMFVGFNLAFFPMHPLGIQRHAAAHQRLLARRGLDRLQPDLDRSGPS